jgi:uncharacterized membrane protein
MSTLWHRESKTYVYLNAIVLLAIALAISKAKSKKQAA